MKKIASIIFLASLILSCQSDDEDDLVICDDPGQGGNGWEYNPTPYDLDVPSNFQFPIFVDDIELTNEGVDLGRHLFYDPRLSLDNTVSCSTCHAPDKSFSDSVAFSEGVGNRQGDRNSMPLINLGYAKNYFWDGRASSLTHQAFMPVVHPDEMNVSWAEVENRLNQDSMYLRMFYEAYGIDEIDSVHVAKSLAQFELTLISGNSRFDQFMRNEIALTPQELNGLSVFIREDKADCFHCHPQTTAQFSDYLFHNNGLDMIPSDIGLEQTTGSAMDKGKFKSPTLRNLAFTAPYMHDGRFSTIEEVVNFYVNDVNVTSPHTDPLMKKANRPNGVLQLTQGEIDALLAFLNTLNDASFTENPNFQDPFN